MPFKNTYKVYLKYNSLLNSGWTQSILETYKFKLYFSVTNIGNQNISPKVYLKYTSYIGYRSIFEAKLNFSRTKY